MNHDHEAITDYALDLWCNWMRSDFGEIRQLWYPSQTPGLHGGWSRSNEAFEDLNESLESRVVIIVNRAVSDMTPAMRAALEASLGLLKVCRIRNQDEQAAEARARIWRVLCSEGFNN